MEASAFPAAHRSRAQRSLVAALAACLVALAGPAGLCGAEDKRPSKLPYETDGVPLLDPDYRRNSHKVVLITDQSLSPNTVVLDEGQLVAWISYSKVPSQIVFEREVARDMICHNLVNFSIEDDELKSAEIRPGEFASFCELKPGRYRYKVRRPDSKMAGQEGSARLLEGVILVGNP